MSNIADMTERHRQALTELAELGLSLARKIHAQAESVEDVEQAAELSLAFHRVSRSVRQTVALEAKLERDARTPANDDAPKTTRDLASAFGPSRSARLDASALREHSIKMRSAVEKMIYETFEGEVADWLMEDVDFQLASLDPEIMSVPIESYVARLRRELQAGEPANGIGPDEAEAAPPIHSSA